MNCLRDEYSQQLRYLCEKLQDTRDKLTKGAKHKTVDEIAAKIVAVHLYGWHILIVLPQSPDHL